jgi:hypothetical protein
MKNQNLLLIAATSLLPLVFLFSALLVAEDRSTAKEQNADDRRIAENIGLGVRIKYAPIWIWLDHIDQLDNAEHAMLFATVEKDDRGRPVATFGIGMPIPQLEGEVPEDSLAKLLAEMVIEKRTSTAPEGTATEPIETTVAGAEAAKFEVDRAKGLRDWVYVVVRPEQQVYFISGTTSLDLMDQWRDEFNALVHAIEWIDEVHADEQEQ